MSTPAELDNLAIENFRDYIRIPSLSQTTDYEDCVNFLQKQATDLNLECEIVRVKKNRPIVVIKWPGTNPKLPAIALNSHMDVVPVEEDKWSHPPFAAHMDETGRIYGRGTQDMKLVGIQQLEAIRRMKLEKVRLAKTIVVTFVPDEELGGQEGMKLFVQTPEWQALNIGFGLDEGVASQSPNKLVLFYGEKHKWSVKFHVTGDVGHGSCNKQNTAAEKLTRLMKNIYDYREDQRQASKLADCSTDVTSINITMIQGGSQENVIPSEFILGADIRLESNVNLAKWQATLNAWCKNAGEGVWIEENVCEIVDKPTPINYTNPYYQPLVDTVKEMGFEVLPEICFAVTDARFLRNLGIPVFGLSMLTGPVLVHMHDEYVDRKDFLLGIQMYYRVLLKLGNLKF